MILSSHGILSSSISSGSAFDADYQAVLNYATSLGYTLPSAGQQVKQNQLMLDLKSGGIWSKLDTFAVFANDGGSNFALIDWKRLVTMTAVNSPTFTTNIGFDGNGTSSYIDTNFDLSNLTTKLITNQQSISTGLYIPRVDSATPQYILGNLSSTEFRIHSGNMTTTTNRYMGSRYAGDWSGTGLMSVHRVYNASVADLKVFNNKTNVTTGTPTNTYSTITGSNILIARHTNLYNENPFSIFFSGASLISENNAFVDATTNYITSL